METSFEIFIRTRTVCLMMFQDTVHALGQRELGNHEIN
jgi:hypothetical protein